MGRKKTINKTSHMDNHNDRSDDEEEDDDHDHDVELHNYVIDETTALTGSDEALLMTLEEKAKMFDMQSAAANRLSIRLLNTSTEEEEDRVLRETLDLSLHPKKRKVEEDEDDEGKATITRFPIGTIVALTLLFFAGLAALMIVGLRAVGPPNRPVGPYTLVERQVSWTIVTETIADDARSYFCWNGCLSLPFAFWTNTAGSLHNINSPFSCVS
jgi:hypothetical protein